ncbi:hypothetical protein PLESTF_001674900 [Pleodorina starrii]|nr:hypothetical protein PLESTF_001674900 [Pleodorina starrii]
MNNEQNSPSFLRFQVCHTLDVSSVVTAPSTTIIRGLYPRCVCFHPTKPLMALGVSGFLAVYDMQSNTRLGRVDLKSVPVEMAFAPDGSVIIVVVQDWILYSVSTSSWKARLVVPRRAKMDKPLEGCLLAVTPGNNPLIYFCRYAKDTLRLATLPSRAGGVLVDGGGPGGGGGGRGSGGWGTRVKLDVQKAILGLACHPLDAQLLVLTADGQLRGYAVAGAGGDVLAPLFAVQVQDPSDKLAPPCGVLTCVPHPGLPAGCIILQGARAGTVAVLEAPGRTAPTVVHRGRVPYLNSTIGMGVCRTNGTLLVFGHNEFGRLRCTSWRLQYRQGAGGLALRPSRVEPQDLTPLLDVGRRTRAALAGAMTTGALAAGHGFVAGPGAGAIAPGNGGSGGTAVAAAACHGLWGLSPGWVQDTSSSCLLEAHLGPPTGRVLVHPGLGLLVAVPDLPRVAPTKREVLFAARGGLSGEDLALARRTSTLVLMTVHNLEAPAAGWRGARLAQQHTPLTAWMPSNTTAAGSHAADPLQQQSQQQQPGGAAAAVAAAAGDSSDEEAPAAPAAAAPPRDKVAEAADAAVAEGGALALPPHVYYLAGSRLMKYSLAPRSACTLVQLPPAEGPDGDVRVARQVVHSARAGAWLLFFEQQGGGGGGGGGGGPGGPSGGGANGGTGGGAGPAERFSWTLINAPSFSSEGGAGFVSWIRSGKSGCFGGPSDCHFVVLSANGKLLELFHTADTSGATAGNPLLTLGLEGAGLMPGLGATVFPGPPMTNAPVAEARAPPEAPPHDVRRFRGSGVVLWQSADMALNMTTLPALQRVPLEPPPPRAAPPPRRPAVAPVGGSSSDEEYGYGYGAAAADATYGAADAAADAAAEDDAPPVYPSIPMGHHFGPQQRQAHLPLLPQEAVIHVAWQSLAIGGGAADAEGPADAVAAVLTTQRLLLVTAGLRVVCAVSLATHGSAALQEPLTSVVWAGPMLLASTAAGQILQLTWTGQLLPVATVSPTGHMALLGVTADSLLLLRTPLAAPTAAGNAAAAAALAEVVARPAALLQPLLIGWASLAATGLLSYGSGGAAVVRPALRRALASYDAASFTPRGVWALIAAGAWDVAAAVAAHMPPLDGAVKLAAAAAAGDWAEVSATLLAEASRALHAPAPPPRGSELHCKLVAAAAGALFHGQLTTAGTLFQAAGEWPAAMILAVCRGRSEELSAIAHKLANPAGAAAGGTTAAAPAPAAPTPESQLAGQLASALRNVYGGVGTPAEDLSLTLALPGPPGTSEPLERAERWPLAAPLAAPNAVAVLLGLPRAAVTDAELGPIPPCPDRGSAVSYYGLTASAAAAVSAAVAAAAAATAAGGGGGGRPPAAGGASATGSSIHRPGGSTALGDLETHSVDSSDAAQAAARAEFLNQFAGGGPTIDFSSDEDDSGSEATGSATGSSAAAGGDTRRRIKLQIRDRGAAGAAGSATGPLLREAASGIRLAPPALGSAQLSLPPSAASPGPAPAAPAPAPAPVQFPPGMSSAQLYSGGAALMEAGDWRGAAAHFSRAMSMLSHEERGALDEAARRARLGFCAQYYAAVRLLEGVAGAAGPREARLYRYLGGLTLDPKHSNALLREAIARNRTAGNYRYAADQLTALIAKLTDSAPADYLMQLQGEIEECDRHGGRDAHLPADERVADWAQLVGRADSKEEVDALVLPLLN